MIDLLKSDVVSKEIVLLHGHVLAVVVEGLLPRILLMNSMDLEAAGHRLVVDGVDGKACKQ